MNRHVVKMNLRVHIDLGMRAGREVKHQSYRAIKVHTSRLPTHINPPVSSARHPYWES